MPAHDIVAEGSTNAKAASAWSHHEAGGADVRSLCWAVRAHLRGTDDRAAVIVDGNDGQSRRFLHPQAVSGFAGEVAWVGVRLAGLDGRIDDRPDRGPVVGRCRPHGDGHVCRIYVTAGASRWRVSP